MRYAGVAFRFATLALAVGATTVPAASARTAIAAAARCTPDNAGITAATEVTGDVTVSGKAKWKSLKPGSWVITNDRGTVNICVSAHRTFCRVGPNSYVRVQPPKHGVLLRAGLSLDLACFQNNTKVELSQDGAGF